MTHKTNLSICGSEKTIVDFDTVVNPTLKFNDFRMPEATDSFRPIHHHTLVEKTREQVKMAGLNIVQEMHSLARGGQRFFALFQVNDTRRSNSEQGTIIGLRNSHDKAFAAGLVYGSQVFVCDNLCFSGEVKLARKHTTNIMRDLSFVIARTIGKLGEKWDFQEKRTEQYKNVTLSDSDANDLIINACRSGAVPKTKVMDVAEQWRNPNHDDFAPRNVWSLHNAFTECLKGNLLELPKRTEALHSLLDNRVGLLANN